MQGQQQWGSVQAYPQAQYMEEGRAGQQRDDFIDTIDKLDVNLRHGFVRKVFSILFLQLVVTFSIVVAFTLAEPVKEFVQTSGTLFYISYFVAFVLIIVLSCFSSVARSHPFGLLFLAAVTLTLGYVVGTLATFTEPTIVYIAIGATLGLVLGLVAFSFQTKYDFTGKAPYLFVGLIALWIFGITLIFIEEARSTRIVFAALGVLLFSFLLVYDLQLIIGGKSRRYTLSVDEYVFASLSLYLDIIYIFIFLLIGGNQA